MTHEWDQGAAGAMGVHFDYDHAVAEVVEIEAGPAGWAVGQSRQDAFDGADGFRGGGEHR